MDARPTPPVLSVENLAVAFSSFGGDRAALDGISLAVRAGHVTSLVGETGSGKSVLVKAILRMLPQNARLLAGRVEIDGKDIAHASENEMRRVRGGQIGLVVTNPRSHLNPVQPVGSQIEQAIMAHSPARRAQVAERALELVRAVGIPDPRRRMAAFPHELSGGMCQRIVIAMALANRPRLILADEPTAGLDVTIQLQIMELIQALVAEMNSAVILVTRDLSLAAHFSDDLAVMRAGRIVEHAPTKRFFLGPEDPYSRRLLDTTRTVNTAAADIAAGIVGDAILDVEGLTKHFPLRNEKGIVYAVNDVTLTIRKGETLALVGESGSGKTTVGRTILGLTRPTAGTVRFLDIDLAHASKAEMHRLRPRMQIVFQEPGESLDPRFRIGRSVEEPLLHRGGLSQAERQKRIAELLDLVRLPRETIDLYPHQISGGQQQRAAIARAIATDPDLVVLDEPTSSLDISVRGEILSLLKQLQERLHMSYLFISHDLSAVEQLSHRVAVMYLGSVVESGDTASIFRDQFHPYGRALLSSALHPDPQQKRTRLVLTGEIPSPVRQPVGCPLAGRCPIDLPRCAEIPPPVVEVTQGHRVACHRIHEVIVAGSVENLAAGEGRLAAPMELVT
jgi:oligopeptide/dipeptide ABC transporter ATP-binding protein